MFCADGAEIKAGQVFAVLIIQAEVGPLLLRVEGQPADNVIHVDFDKTGLQLFPVEYPVLNGQ